MQNSLLRGQPHLRLLRSLVRYRSQRSENYYDILKLKRNCTSKEIRNAFVQLSKKYHPDVKGVTADRKQNADFIKILEAYKVLSKPQLRTAYDNRLSDWGSVHHGDRPHSGGVHTTEFHRPWEVHPNYDRNPGPYYGVKGLNRVSNFTVAFILTALGIFGALFGFASVKHSFTFSRAKLDQKSAEANSYHAAVRADAEKYGNEEQLRRMMKRMAKDEA